MKPIKDEVLDEWMGTDIKAFTVQGGCLTGRLLKYDSESILITPKTYVQREKIVSAYQAHNAPIKEAPRPAVR